MLVFISARFGWVGGEVRSPHMCLYFKGISMRPRLLTKSVVTVSLYLLFVDKTEPSCCWWMRSWLSVNYWQCVGNQRKLVSILVEIISLYHHHNQSINQRPGEPHYRGYHYSLWLPVVQVIPVNPGNTRQNWHIESFMTSPFG